jgi:predicted ABC-type transport system involved in lysophospholipase L1 biosynthesis ATPase subunit
MVMVTHDSSIAARAQRLGILSGGRLSIRQGTWQASL